MSWLSDLFGGKKAEVTPVIPERYPELRDLLFNVAKSPDYYGFGDYYNKLYNQTIVPTSREAYETKRNPYGTPFSDTPQSVQLAQEANRGLTSIFPTIAGYRNSALGQLGGLLQPSYNYTPASEGIFGDVLGLGLGMGLADFLPKAMSGAGNYLGKLASSAVTPQSPSSVFSESYKNPYVGLGKTALDIGKYLPGPQQPFVMGADLFSDLFF